MFRCSRQDHAAIGKTLVSSVLSVTQDSAAWLNQSTAGMTESAVFDVSAADRLGRGPNGSVSTLVSNTHLAGDRFGFMPPDFHDNPTVPQQIGSTLA